MKGFERGSEWRRWDLHIHTPGTKKNDQFKGDTIEEKWDNFYKDLNDYMGDGSDPLRSVAVLGITDYLSIDNYCKILNERDKLPSCVKLILPNVELRVLPMARDHALNLHCIFSPELTAKQIETRFFNKLKVKGNDGRVYSANKYELIDFGRLTKSDADDDTAYTQGLDQYVIPLNDLVELFDGDPDIKEKTVIIVADKTSDGASGVDRNTQYMDANGTSSLSTTRNSCYSFADLIFTSSEKTREYFLGQGPAKAAEIINTYGSLKGCIHGSDAHTNKKICEPDNQKYCWIKADPTFNGLKQIIYEPEERICISPLLPEEKRPYQVINQITIHNDWFSDQPIVFNDDLNCIIGGKSTGKSFLLMNIANAIDPAQVEEKLDKSAPGRERGTGRNSSYDERCLPGVEVQWSDGTVSNPNGEVNHRIVYIPQAYLNRLTDNPEENTEINRLIEDVLLLKESVKDAKEDMLSELETNKENIESCIREILKLDDQVKQSQTELRALGNEKGIKENIAKLLLEKERISKNLNLNPEDIEKYEQLLENQRVLTWNIKCHVNDKKILEHWNLSFIIQGGLEQAGFTLQTKDKIQSVRTEIYTEARKRWEEEKTKLLTDIDENIQKWQKDLKIYEAPLKELEPLVQKNKALKQLNNQINEERQRLNEVIEKGHQIDELIRNLDDTINSAFDGVNKYKSIHEKFSLKINEDNELSQENLDFSAIPVFRKDAFKEHFDGMLDRRKRNANRVILDWEEAPQGNFEKEKFKEIIYSVLDSKLGFVSGTDPENFLRNFMFDWYNTAYQVKMGNDTIDKMSPGKKSLVLLKLIIGLAQSTYPILIDQPEDDLDNRSIFKELIPYIREKKKTRQIIMVTHNANLVVGSDAEEVIVANQEGAGTPNDQYRFEYRSGAIEDDQPLEGNGKGILGKQGIQQHICEILEGGNQAFELRKKKYHI